MKQYIKFLDDLKNIRHYETPTQLLKREFGLKDDEVFEVLQKYDKIVRSRLSENTELRARVAEKLKADGNDEGLADIITMIIEAGRYES